MIVARMKPALMQGVALAALFALGGCMSSPTYGTGKTANAQLMEDVSTAFSLKPKPPTGIKYEPRPDVLKTGAAQALPAPQDSVTKQAGVWPESPEDKRARLRDEATLGQNDPNFEPTILDDVGSGKSGYAQTINPNADRDARKRTDVDRADIKQRKVANAVGSPTNRKHLSEPPVEYRQPVDGAGYGDLGEDEAKKERRLRAEARKKKGGKSIKDYIPWL